MYEESNIRGKRGSRLMNALALKMDRSHNGKLVSLIYWECRLKSII